MHNQFAKRFLACAIATLTAATAIVPNGTVFASVLSSNQSTLSQSVTSDIMISDYSSFMFEPAYVLKPVSLSINVIAPRRTFPLPGLQMITE